MAVSALGRVENFDVFHPAIEASGRKDRVSRKWVHVDLVEAGPNSKGRGMNVRQHLPN